MSPRKRGVPFMTLHIYRACAVLAVFSYEHDGLVLHAMRTSHIGVDTYKCRKDEDAQFVT